MQFEDFEWDDNKALQNLAKHGVSFEEASEAIEDAIASETVSAPFRSKSGETRFEAEGVSG